MIFDGETINLNKNSSKMFQKQQILQIFNSIESLDDKDVFVHLTANYNLLDIEQPKNFLKSYKGSFATFNSYRREIEHLLQQ